MTNIPDDEHKDIINEILLMCAELMLIPDIRNRNMLAKRITKKFLVNDIIAENDVLIEDVTDTIEELLKNINFDFVEILNSQFTSTNCFNIFLVSSYFSSNLL